MKAGCLSFNSSSLKLIFTPLPWQEKNQVPNWNQGVTGVDVPPGSAPPQDCLWQGLKHMPFDKVEHTLRGLPRNVRIK